MRKISEYYSLLYFIFFCCSTKDLSAKIDFDIYRPPTSSYHCKHLSDKRQDNLKIKQQLVSLLERNSRLIKNTPKEKETTYRKLVFLRGEIKFKLEKHIFRLRSVEETLVRRGCPSILSTNS